MSSEISRSVFCKTFLVVILLVLIVAPLNTTLLTAGNSYQQRRPVASRSMVGASGDTDVGISSASDYLYFNGNRSLAPGDARLEWIFSAPSPWPVNASPIVVDVDGDSRPEIVVMSLASVICLEYNISGGVHVDWNWSIGEPLLNCIDVADTDGDQFLERVVGTIDGRVISISDNPTRNWTFKTPTSAMITSVISANLDGDGFEEIVAGCADWKTYCLDSDGTLLWNYTIGEPVFAPPAIGHLDEDLENELAIGSRNGTIYFLDQNGGLKCKYDAQGLMYCSPAILSDISGQPSKIVAAAGNWLWCLYLTPPYFNSVSVRWGSWGEFTTWCQLGVGDLNLDGWYECAAVTMNGQVHCEIGHSGGAWFIDTYIALLPPLLTDVDNDSFGEILATSQYGLILSLNQEAWVESNFTISGPSYPIIPCAPAVADIDLDGYPEIIIATLDFNIHCLNVTAGIRPLNPPQILPLLLPAGLITVVIPIFIVYLIVRRRESAGKGKGIPQPEGGAANTTLSASLPGEIESRTRCLRCRTIIPTADAEFCPSCGASLKTVAMPAKTLRTKERLGIEKWKPTAHPPIALGRCMVCGFQLKESDELLSCPYCGSFAHKTHLLEWLHVKSYCPTCSSHLDEQDMRLGRAAPHTSFRRRNALGKKEHR